MASMLSRRSFAAVLALALSGALAAQTYPRRRPNTGPGDRLDSYKGVAGTFHGKMKDISGKEIVIENEDEQLVSIRRSGKTKFLKDSKPVKPSDIEAGTPLTIEAVEDLDLSIVALTVTVDPPAKK